MIIEKQLNITQAVKHLTWRLHPEQGKKIIPNEKDVEAFNLILQTLNSQYEQGLIQDILFAKMLCDKLLMLTIPGDRTMKSAIEVVEEILSRSMDGWSKAFQDNIPLIKLSKAFEDEFIRFRDSGNLAKDAASVREAKLKLIAQNQNKLRDLLTKPYTHEEFTGFITQLVHKLKIEHQNKP